MAEVLNAVSAVTIITPDQLEGEILKEGELCYVRGLAQVVYGDGLTAGGLPIASGGGGGGSGDAIAFRTIAVEGVDPGQWVQADQASDVLTLRGTRGFVITPIPGTDTIVLGLPDGGAFGNVPTWTGSAYVPNPPDVAMYEQQEGDLTPDLMREETRKFWDGWLEIDTYLAPADPAWTTIVGGIVYPSMGASASGFLWSMPFRFPDNNYTAVAVTLRVETAATTGDIVMAAKMAALPAATATPAFGAQSTIAQTVPGDGSQFDITVVIDDLGGADQGAQCCVELGRLGGATEDTCTSAVTVVGTWFRML